MVFEQIRHVEQVIYGSLWVSSHGVLEMITLHAEPCLQSITSLVSSVSDSVPITIVPELN